MPGGCPELAGLGQMLALLQQLLPDVAGQHTPQLIKRQPQAIFSFVCIATNMFLVIHDPYCSGNEAAHTSK
jgi:hypothetical protein